MIKRAYIQEYGSGKLDQEHKDVVEVLTARGIEYELFTEKMLARNRLKLDEETFVSGNVSTIRSVLKKIGFDYSDNTYPRSLENYLGRRVWATTIRGLHCQNSLTEISGIFVKPKSKAKLFTGYIIESEYDLFKLDRFSKRTEIYCSTLVNWLSEYRVYVNNSEIVGIKHYWGDPTIKLDTNIVENAVNDFQNSKEKTIAYGIDFGVTDSGQTTLIEWNDGFSLGSYGLDKEIYTDLLLARWDEILRKV